MDKRTDRYMDVWTEEMDLLFPKIDSFCLNNKMGKVHLHQHETIKEDYIAIWQIVNGSLGESIISSQCTSRSQKRKKKSAIVYPLATCRKTPFYSSEINSS